MFDFIQFFVREQMTAIQNHVCFTKHKQSDITLLNKFFINHLIIIFL